MAKVFLDPGDEYRIVNDNENVYGGSGDEQVIIESGADNVVLDQNVERVDFAGNVSDFQFQQAGNMLEVYDSDGNLVTQVGVQEDGTDLAFFDGLVELTVDTETHAMLLGGAEVPQEQAASVTPETIDESQTSEAEGGTEGGEGGEGGEGEGGEGGGGETTTGETFVLTKEQDTIDGTDQDDLIYGTADTLNDFDMIDGNGGTDTLQLSNSATKSFYPNLSDVETLKVRALGGTTTVDLGNVSGVEEVVYDKGSANLTVKNISSAVDVGVEGGNGSTFTLNFKDAVVSGSDDSINVTLTDANLNNLYLDDDDGPNANSDDSYGFETVNLTVSGTSKITGDFANDSGGKAAINTVNISGDGKLTIDDTTAGAYALDGVQTINASEATGNITVDANPADLKSFTGGSGDDTLKLTGANIGVSSLTIDGGDGDDRVVVDHNSYDALQDSTKVTMSNVETVRCSDGTNDSDDTLDASKLSGVSTFEVEVADKDNDSDVVNITISNVEGEVNVVAIDSDANPDVSDDNDGVKITVSQKATYSGTDDVLNFTIKNGEVINELNAGGFETVNITSTKGSDVAGSVTNKIVSDDGTGNYSSGLVVADAKTITVSGDQDLTLKVGNYKEAVAGNTSYKPVFDASAFTGDLDVTFNESANQSITGGSGDDKITLNAGSLDKHDVIDGGAGTDTVIDGDVNITDGSSLNITNVEKLQFTFDNGINATQKFSLANDTALSELTLDLNGGSAADQDIEVSGIANNATVIVDDDADDTAGRYLQLNLASGADTLTVKFDDTAANGQDFDDALKTNAATLTLQTADGETDITIDNLTDSSLTSLTLNGSGDIT